MSCLEKRRKLMDTVFKCDQHKRLVDQGYRKLSHRALKGAMVIYAYRHEKGYGLANRILESLVDIDSLLSKWRCKYSSADYVMNNQTENKIPLGDLLAPNDLINFIS